jgi:hypothetical protein
MKPRPMRDDDKAMTTRTRSGVRSTRRRRRSIGRSDDDVSLLASRSLRIPRQHNGENMQKITIYNTYHYDWKFVFAAARIGFPIRAVEVNALW